MARTPESAAQPLPRTRIFAFVCVALLLATGAAWGYALLTEMPLPGFGFSAAEMAETIRAWGVWGAVGIVALMVVHAFVPFPAEFCALAAGMIYGPVWGTVWVWIGAMLGALLSFGLTRWLGRPFVAAMLPERHRRGLDAWTERQGGSTLFVSRLIPVIAFNLINYAAGLTRISWWSFTWITGLGILPLTVLMVVMGDRMSALDGWVWAALFGLALGSWAALWAFRRARAPRPRPAP